MSFLDNNDIKNGLDHFINMNDIEKKFIQQYIRSSYNLVYYAYKKKYKPLQKMIRHMFDNAPVLQHPIILYRGIDNSYKCNIEMSMPYIFSTSFSKKVAQDFMYGSKCCLFEIHVPKGTKFLTYNTNNIYADQNDKQVVDKNFFKKYDLPIKEYPKSSTNLNTHSRYENEIVSGNFYQEVILQGGDFKLIEKNDNKYVVEFIEREINFDNKIPDCIKELLKFQKDSWCYLENYKLASGTISQNDYNKDFLKNAKKNITNPCFKNSKKLKSTDNYSKGIIIEDEYMYTIMCFLKHGKYTAFINDKGKHMIYSDYRGIYTTAFSKKNTEKIISIEILDETQKKILYL